MHITVSNVMHIAITNVIHTTTTTNVMHINR